MPASLSDILFRWLKDTFSRDSQNFTIIPHSYHHSIDSVPNIENVRAVIQYNRFDLFLVGPDWVWFTPPIVFPDSRNATILHAHELDFKVMEKHVREYMKIRRAIRRISF